MQTFLILGAGTAGIMMARKMVRALDPDQWKVILVDKSSEHYYQPGFLFIPFGMYKKSDVVKPNRNFVARGVEYVVSPVEQLEPAENRVTLGNGRVIHYDYLLIATGTDIRPDQTEGMLDGGWRQNIFDFYTYEGAAALANAIARFEGGRIVVNVVEMPIKCPVAPMEFLFLANWYFTRKGLRDKVELVYTTPLPGAFTKPQASARFGSMLESKNIHVETEYAAGWVDASRNVLSSYDEREIPYDLLVTVPLNMGAEFIGSAGLGDELNFVKTDKYTLQSTQYENIFAMGDAANLPTSKAGAVVHFQMHTAFKNIMAKINGKPFPAAFDGHALCYIETGFNKATLIDFDYEQEPLPGKYPLPGIGPFDLMGETLINHWGKLAFKYMYWDLMLKGIEVPLPVKFSMAGKKLVPAT